MLVMQESSEKLEVEELEREARSEGGIAIGGLVWMELLGTECMKWTKWTTCFVLETSLASPSEPLPGEKCSPKPAHA